MIASMRARSETLSNQPLLTISDERVISATLASYSLANSSVPSTVMIELFERMNVIVWPDSFVRVKYFMVCPFVVFCNQQFVVMFLLYTANWSLTYILPKDFKKKDRTLG